MLSLKNVHKTYFQRKKPICKAVRGVTFDIRQGEIFSLLGVNGAGKTTLSGILAGLHPPTSGDILWRGKSIYSNILKYKATVGFCPQKSNVDPNLAISETLEFVARCFGKSQVEARRRRDDLIDLFDLGNYADSVAQHLSGGYKQRFLIARTLAHSPTFVILDEPTIGLDPQIRKNLWKIIESLKGEKMTVLLTTHYLEEAEVLSDRVCLIEKGEIRALDTPENLNKTYNQSCLEDVFLLLTGESNKGEAS